MESVTYRDALAANVRAARARKKLSQELVAARMRALGFTEWQYQTVGKVERGSEKGGRRLLAEEIMALAAVLELSIPVLMSPAADEGEIQFPAGGQISARSAALWATGYYDRAVTWDGEKGDEPKFMPDDGEVTVQVVVRPRWLAGSSPVDPAIPEGARAPLPEE